MDKVRWTLIITDKSTGWDEDTVLLETFTPYEDSKELIPAFDGKVLACMGVTDGYIKFRLIDQEAHV